MALSVLVVSTNDGFGGGEFYARDLALALERSGHSTMTFIAGTRAALDDELTSRGLSVVRSGVPLRVSRPVGLLRNARKLRRAAKISKADVVIANLPRSVILAALAMPWLKRIALLHGPLRKDPISRATRLLVRRCLTNTSVNEVALRAQLPGAKVGVIYPTAWPSELRSLARDRITMVGRWQPYKGHMDFVRMAASLHDRDPELKFEIVGSVANEEQAQHLQKVRDEVARLGLTTSVGIRVDVSGEELADILSRTSVYVHPASSEDFGISIIEALLAGCPVVAYRAAGPKIILDGKPQASTLVDIGDVDALSNEVQKMIDLASRSEDPRASARAVGESYSFGPIYAAECSRVVESLAE